MLVTTILVVRYIRKKNRLRRASAAPGETIEELDTSVVSATIVLMSLPQETRDRVLEQLPHEMSRAIVLMVTELPPIADVMVDKERARWLGHLSPPRTDLSGLESVDSRQLAAATVRMVLEDSA